MNRIVPGCPAVTVYEPCSRACAGPVAAVLVSREPVSQFSGRPRGPEPGRPAGPPEQHPMACGQRCASVIAVWSGVLLARWMTSLRGMSTAAFSRGYSCLEDADR